jgi:hypothetical protein
VSLFPLSRTKAARAKRSTEIVRSIDLIETLGPDVAWSIGTIVNETHMMPPYGRGLMVAIRGPGTDAHPQPIMVIDKSGDGILDATTRAVERFKQRQQGMSGK